MSVRLKRFAAGALAPIGAFRAWGALQRIGSGSLLILGYHRVLPTPDEREYIGDIELVSASPDEFEWQMRYLAARFDPVTFEQIAEALEGGAALPKRAVTVTFDDGFHDLHAFALPVLKKTSMSATVFVATDYVDKGDAFWFDHVAWAVCNAPAAALPLPQSMRPLVQVAGKRDERRIAVALLKFLKSCDEAEREAYVSRIRDDFPLPPGMALGRALTWPEIREMSAAGIEFGSHTVTHRCLARLSEDELRHELGHSRRRLEEETGKAVTALSYPFGGPAAFNGEVIAMARRLGYRVATTYMPGANPLRNAEPFSLLRQHVERYTSRAQFEAIVNLPDLFR